MYEYAGGSHDIPTRSKQEASVSILIKTTDRPKCLHHLIHAIQRDFPQVAILVADDGVEDARTYASAAVDDHHLSYPESLVEHRW